MVTPISVTSKRGTNPRYLIKHDQVKSIEGSNLESEGVRPIQRLAKSHCSNNENSTNDLWCTITLGLLH